MLNRENFFCSIAQKEYFCKLIFKKICTMQEPTRLFDLLEWRRELHPERPVFKYKENGEWKEHFIDEYIEKVNLISYALLSIGVSKGENIGLISSGRPEPSLMMVFPVYNRLLLKVAVPCIDLTRDISPANEPSPWKV